MKRHDFDRYDSPHWFVTHLPNYVRLEVIVGEPCKGGGNISNLLPYFDQVSHCWTNDLDPNVDADFNFDAADPKSWDKFPETDWIITNPPFNAALPILQNSLNHARLGVVFFLRLSFVEPTLERGQWLFENPRYLDLIYPRFKFRKGKDGKSWQTDSMPMMAAVWCKDTSETRGSITIPQSHILGFHDNPENAPSFEQQLKILNQVQGD
ncbi:MAG: hypothetical protein ACKPJF_04080 [Dolichospermum sp.]